MYLALLKTEEKELFLELAYNLACSDADYSKEEQVMMDSYCHEMQIGFDIKNMVRTTEEIIDKINENSDEKVKKIFAFELIGLAMVDGNYDDSERELIKKLGDKFGIKDGLSKEFEEILKEYFAFQNKINRLILE